jgi:histidine triad (HIT) family protein
MNDCVFCRIVAGEIPALKVYEDETLVAFLDITPVNLGHTLIVPREHYENLLATPDAVLAAMANAVKKVAKAAMAVEDAPAFNLGVNTGPAAGQVVMHTHFHVMPRLPDDGLEHWPKREVTPEQMEGAVARMRAALAENAA